MPKSKQKKSSKPIVKRLPIKTELKKMSRSELNAVAIQVGIDPMAHKSKVDLSLALSSKVILSKPRASITKKKQSRATKVNWSKAYQWYIEDFSRSYSDVAKQFGVTKKSVENNAKYTYTDGAQKGSWCTWAERRQELGEIAKKKSEEDYKKTAPARSKQHLLQYRNLQIATSQKISMLAAQGQTLVDPDSGKKYKIQDFDARQLADVAKALKLAIDGERVIMGLPTSVSTIKPGSDDDTGKGWGEMIALAMKQAAEENVEI